MAVETLDDRILQLCELLQTAVERRISMDLRIASDTESRHIRILVDARCGETEVTVTYREIIIHQPHCDRVHITDGPLPMLMLVDERDQSAAIMRMSMLE